MKHSNFIMLTLVLGMSFSSHAAPEMFKNSVAMMEDHNDYAPDTGYFKVLKEKPLHVQILPAIFQGDTDKNITYTVNKAAVYAAYRVLFQTPADSVKVTVLPRELDMGTRKYTPKPKHSITFTLTRKRALELTSQYAGISEAKELMQDDGYTWADPFSECCYTDGGNPGLSAFVEELRSK
ncbi:hypothetical protein N5923_09895 [Erwiniaceae bacterium BAC15a-03b]|uniref:Uncharacterized protein n=1 Tax=Winslowiella arboricola TaxID=2978220 RepID=A0A9J6PSR8_9GAMM|nr:hypothetical protein [Winslowiella arboricola]MCU5773101.1 hypothetical protein [Winslowiella arboricola]MCU5777804.1 hypothetical protein [Winslowiella arboricola]